MISLTVQGQSRDSGIGSGDPSPNSGNILLQQQANNAAQWDSGGESGGKTHGRAPPISRSMSQPAVEVAKRAITVKVCVISFLYTFIFL